MAVSSMTGFARTSGEAEWGGWVWEARSVNGRGLDVRVNLPSGLEMIDSAIRTRLSHLFTRGSFQISLKLDLTDIGASVMINEAVLHALMAAYQRAGGASPMGAALATLMGIKGVVEAGSPTVRALAEQPGAVAELTGGAIQVIDQLKESRDTEGVKLQSVILGQLSEIDALSEQSRAFSAAQVASIRSSFAARLSEIDREGRVGDDRVAAEILVLATKADVLEELDRLRAHVGSARSLIASEAAIGRNLGFLAQEFNREVNTLCSKSASLDLTNTGLALKSVIDQFKEQSANVE